MLISSLLECLKQNLGEKVNLSLETESCVPLWS